MLLRVSWGRYSILRTSLSRCRQFMLPAPVFRCRALVAVQQAQTRTVSKAVQRRSKAVVKRILQPEHGSSPQANDIKPAASLSAFSKYRALVLDTSYRPIDVVNWQRALVLDLFDKVDVLEYYDMVAHSACQEFYLPAVMRVRMYIQRDQNGGISLSRRNVMLRDGLACQYCGDKANLTIDHVVPASKGGSWAWDNLVTACDACNCKKGNKTLKQLGWKLGKLPVEPTAWQVGVLVGMDAWGNTMRNTPPEWQSYLIPFTRRAREDAFEPAL